ncbi:alpha/beta fold hydrolase [Pseudonocardia sp. RS010]|uniref:alpha/beta fold hydrolase n=1 Tax=Pseudonocardia sp. RS010 TaxID=3385979 RepID=UPI0039A0F89D
MTWTHETLTLAGGRTQVVHRAGDGPPLLWLHSLYGFDPDDGVLADLVTRYSVLAPVTPGMTDLGELDDIDDFHDLALHYDDVLEACRLDSVTVVGHSFGALIGAELAAHFPHRVTRLALLSPLGLWVDDEPVLDVFAVPYADVAEVLYADPDNANLRSEQTETGERDIEAVVALAQAMTTVAKFLWPVPDKGLRKRLYRVSAPALVVYGEKDAVVAPSYGDRFAELLPDGRADIVPDAGHMTTREQPEAVSGLLRAFLVS